MVNQQLSRTACVEGRTWGQKPGAVWVNRGCRAVFGVVRTGRRNNNPNAAFNRDPNYGVTCASTSGGRQVCSWDSRYGTPVLIQQLSSSRCVEGRDWGYDRGGDLWVNSGCRARFGYQGMPATSGVWNRDPNYAVTCTSVDGRRSVCDWDNRYGQPRMVQQLSSSACIEGRDWGYDTRGGLWVNSGCRARFGYR